MIGKAVQYCTQMCGMLDSIPLQRDDHDDVGEDSMYLIIVPL